MKIAKTNPVKTVLVISVGFGIVFLLFGFKWALYTSIGVGVLGLISNKAANSIDFAWMKLALILSYIVPNIILTIIFFFFLFPVAVLSKVFGNKNLLQLKNTNDSLWINKSNRIVKESFEKMW